MTYLWVKSFHLVFVVSWMAGLFYLVRLFVYHAEANDAEEPRRGILRAQYAVMEARLLHIITTPAAVLTWATGATMLWLQPAYLTQGWMLTKLGLLVLLTLYHWGCARVMRGLADGRDSRTGEWFRVANEGPTLVLVLAVLLVVFKQAIAFTTLGWTAAGTVAAIWVGFKAYAVARRRAELRRGPIPG